MNHNTKARFRDPDLWIRLVYMILFVLLTWLSRLVLCVIGLLQFLVVLLSGAENRSLRDFSASLAEWTLRCFRFICFNTEQKPFPFDEWPEPDMAAAGAVIALPEGDAEVAEDPVRSKAVGAMATAETTVTEVEASITETDDPRSETENSAGEKGGAVIEAGHAEGEESEGTARGPVADDSSRA